MKIRTVNKPNPNGPFVEDLTGAVATSTGAADQGKVPVLNANGLLDPSLGVPEALTRIPIVLTTTSLLDNGVETGTVPLGKFFALLSVVANVACRVVLYDTDAHMTADAGRDDVTPPGLQAGVILDISLTAGALSWEFTPPVIGMSLESTPSVGISYRVTNKSGATNAVSLTFEDEPMEGSAVGGADDDFVDGGFFGPPPLPGLVDGGTF